MILATKKIYNLINLTRGTILSAFQRSVIGLKNTIHEENIYPYLESIFDIM